MLTILAYIAAYAVCCAATATALLVRDWPPAVAAAAGIWWPAFVPIVAIYGLMFCFTAIIDGFRAAARYVENFGRLFLRS